MSYNFKDVKVLVVESTPPMFALVKGVLQMFTVPDSNIFSAYEVDDAFNKFCQHEHDILIVDWLENPDKGLSLTRKIRKDPKSPNPFVPIVMTAGSGHLQRVLKARDSGISEYLVKPFSATSLAERLTRVIEKPRLFVMSENYTGPDRRTGTKAFNGDDRRRSQTEAVQIKFKSDTATSMPAR